MLVDREYYSMQEQEQDVFYAVFGYVKMNEEFILHIDVQFEGELTLAMLNQHKQMVYDRFLQHVEAGKRIGVLFDVRRISILKVPSSVMRDNATNDPFLHAQKGVALLVKSRILQQVAMFYIRIYRPEINTRVFTDETNARKWLNSLK